MNDDETFWTSTRHWKHFDADQSLARVDPATSEMKVLTGGSGTWRPLTDPDERRAMGIPDDDTAFYLRGAGREHFNLLIDKIEALRDQTDPAKGDPSAVGKDAAAFQALSFAGDLVEGLVGWAIAHQVGLAAEGLSFVPIGPGGDFRNLPEYKEARAQVDAHRHELVGDQLIRRRVKLGLDPKTQQERVSTGPAMDPVTARQAVINLMRSNPGAMPHEIANSLHDALLALDMNDVRPILSPSPADRKVTFAEELLQLEITCFACFRAATELMTMAEAQREVAEAFAISPDTLRKWETRLRQTLGYLPVSSAITLARNSGSQIAASAVAIGKINARPEMMNHHTYGDTKLMDAVDRYRRRKE